MPMRRWLPMALLAGLAMVSGARAQDAGKPNMLVIFGDDIGQSNISAYSRGLMGFTMPNIDRIGNEGGVFITYYSQQSCTAGRAAFITGQCPFRTGLTKVGLPGSPVGLQKEDPTIAEFLKPLGYMCAQFGKNHLGDRDEYSPTNHGFDEFFGNFVSPERGGGAGESGLSEGSGVQEEVWTARHEYFYFSDDVDLWAYRDDRFKYHFTVQLATGMNVWRMPLTQLRAPIMIDLATDPYEYSWDASAYWEKFAIEHSFLVLPAVEKVAAYLATYKEFPPRQRPASFSIDQVIEKLQVSEKSHE